jgi:hypothetical protein
MVIGTTLHSRGENLRFGLHWLDPQVKQYEVTTHCLGIAVLTLICWMCHLECKSLLRPFSLDLATSTQVYFFLCYCRIWCLSFRFSCVRDWLIILGWRSPANVLIWSPQRVVSHGSRTPTAQLFFFKKKFARAHILTTFFCSRRLPNVGTFSPYIFRSIILPLFINIRRFRYFKVDYIHLIVTESSGKGRIKN